jgi:RHS repeat-associated protein
VGGNTETYKYTDVFGNDEQGCMTGINDMTMRWDSKDQLRQVNLGGGGTAYYVYDASGERTRKVIEKNNGNIIEERLYLGGFEIFRRKTNTGTVRLERETLHIMDDKQRIAMIETRTVDVAGDDQASAQLVRYQLSNHLGSSSLELDDQGLVISFEEYHPYGTTAYQAVRNQKETAKRYRYTGKERDEETGFNYHRARYYALWLGRWVSCDPIELGGGIDLYVYATANPVMFIDDNGMADEPPQLIPAYRLVKKRIIEGSGKWVAPKELKPHKKNLAEKSKIDPKDLHWGHEEPRVFKKAGEESVLRLESASDNMKEGRSIAEKANKVRETGGYTREGGSDLTASPDAPKGAKVVPQGKAKELLEEQAKLAGKEAKAGEEAVSGGVGVVAKQLGKKAKIAKAVAKGAGKLAEGVGIVIGVGSALDNFSEGNYLEGILDVGGLIPGPIGTVFDIVGLGVTLYKIQQESEEKNEQPEEQKEQPEEQSPLQPEPPPLPKLPEQKSPAPQAPQMQPIEPEFDPAMLVS